MSNDFREMTTTEIISIAEEMFDDNFKEVSSDKEEIDVKVDYSHYKILEENDQLKIYGLFEEDKIVGYSIYVLASHNHIKDAVIALNDCIYVSPESRGGGGERLISLSEEALYEQGIDYINMSSRKERPYDNLLLKLGYAPLETIYTKNIRNMKCQIQSVQL